MFDFIFILFYFYRVSLMFEYLVFVFAGLNYSHCTQSHLYSISPVLNLHSGEFAYIKFPSNPEVFGTNHGNKTRLSTVYVYDFHIIN